VNPLHRSHVVDAPGRIALAVPNPDVTIPGPGGDELVPYSATASALGVGANGQTTWRISHDEATGKPHISLWTGHRPIGFLVTVVADASHYALSPFTTLATFGETITASAAVSCDLVDDNYSCVLGIGGERAGEAALIHLTVTAPPTNLVYAAASTNLPSTPPPRGQNGGAIGLARATAMIASGLITTLMLTIFIL
jgi:hypothetical protein